MPILSSTKVPFPIRAAAILTNAAVASLVIPVNPTLTQKLMLYVDFTLGSLTNVLIQAQVTYDGTNWFDCTVPGLLTLTATGKKAVLVDVAGAKQFRATAQGTGTVTSSSLQLDAGWQQG
jgi:hypothetical protein